MNFKDLPSTELPRERLLSYGVEYLSNSDLISIVLRTGIKDLCVRDISNNILKYAGDVTNLSNIGIRELAGIKGVGNVKALTLLAAIELGKRVSSVELKSKMQLNTVEKVHDAFKSFFINEKQEKFLAIFLDNHKCLISYKTLFIGTNNTSIVSPTILFNEALRSVASSIIVIHNHPSSNLSPSKEDIETTKKLVESGMIIGIPVIDHIITNGEEYFSFYDKYNEIFTY